MFYSNRWFKKVNLSRFKNEKDINNIVNQLFSTFNKDGKPEFDVIEVGFKSIKQQTTMQKINCIWFFIIYWLLIAPYLYIKTGNRGIDQRTPIGKIAERLVGQIKIRGKVSDYKSGWCHYMTKEEFVKLMEDKGIKNGYDFYYNFIDLDTKSYHFLVEDPNDIFSDNKTKLERFNILWLTPIYIVMFMFVAPYRWLRYNDFGLKSKGKLLNFYDKMTNSKKEK